jgi:hypothetical protein
MNQPKKPPSIEVIAVTYRQPNQLAGFVYCFLCQSAGNWKLVAYHDGPDEGFEAQMREFEAKAPGKIEHHATEVRHNDWGHSLRSRALERASSDYVLLTNADNYYVPRFIECANEVIAAHDPDVVIFNMVHSYSYSLGNEQKFTPPYSPFPVRFEHGQLDMGAALVRTAIAKRVGFRSREFGADQTYFDDVRAVGVKVVKVQSILFVHN